MVVTTVRPPLASRLIVVRILWAVVESKPDVGSSSSSKLGLISISWPILTLFFSPPDIPLKSGPPIMLFRHRLNPSSVITRCTCCAFSSLVNVLVALAVQWTEEFQSQLDVGTKCRPEQRSLCVVSWHRKKAVRCMWSFRIAYQLDDLLEP